MSSVQIEQKSFRVLQEGEVGAGDYIVKITDGPERISVADVDALLYLQDGALSQRGVHSAGFLMELDGVNP